MATPASPERPITGRFVLIVLLSFFSVVITVNMVMMRLAIATLPGTEVDSAYSASLAYQREIEAASEQSARRWKIDAHVERRSDGTATLTLQARDASGAPLTGLFVAGQFERPIDRRADHAVDIVENGNGSYRGIVRNVSPGQWDLVIEASSSGKRMFLSRNRIVLN